MFKCELRKENEDGMFYRYSMDDIKVWFTQTKQGNIFGVNISTNKALSGFDFYVHIREDEWYPNYVYFRTYDNRFYDNCDIDRFIDRLTYAKIVQNSIMDIFNLDEHKKQLKQ